MERYKHDGLTFDVTDGGPAGGEPVVLLHGFPQDRTAWDAVSERLHARGMRTLAPDQRGYSPGARPRGRRRYTIGRLAGDVVALLDAAGLQRAHVVGHDWGGAVAWAVAGSAPERVASVTVVSTPHPAAFARSFVTSTQALHSWYMLAFQLPAIPEAVLRHRRAAVVLASSGLPADRADYYAARLRDRGSAAGGVNWYRGMPLSFGAQPPRCAVPATLIWSPGDRFLLRAGVEATRRYVTADYRLAVIDDGNHWLPETHPAEVAGLIAERAESSPIG